eukprot:TRINITY_DN16638_c0_g1_i1.p1 TRINITY_DN16638_c0_g1~~TRINITY_DN16638_c0_g1_i1.p1  ORF type:complete len:224 (+),score=35.53 TRINITY_DN16638_c0_g1_i1:90-674(+)
MAQPRPASALTIQLPSRSDCVPFGSPTAAATRPASGSPMAVAAGSPVNQAFCTPSNVATTIWRTQNCPLAPAARGRGYLRSAAVPWAAPPVAMSPTSLAIRSPVNRWPTPRNSPAGVQTVQAPTFFTQAAPPEFPLGSVMNRPPLPAPIASPQSNQIGHVFQGTPAYGSPKAVSSPKLCDFTTGKEVIIAGAGA